MHNLTQVIQFLSRFINRPDVYAVQTVEKKAGVWKHGYRPIWNSIASEIFDDHLAGLLTLGVYSTSLNLDCLWCCWDIDVKDESKTQILLDYLTSNKLYPIRESVKFEKSGHIWLFFDKPVLVTECRRLGAYAKFWAGLDCEFFAKQDKVSLTSPGNLVRLPLGQNQKPGAGKPVGLFYDCESRDLSDQLLWFLEQPLNLAEHMLQVVETTPQLYAKTHKKRRLMHTDRALIDEFPEGWPMRDLHNGEVEARCPNCAANGWDTQCSNLNINTVDNLLFCHRGCTFEQVIAALKKLAI